MVYDKIVYWKKNLFLLPTVTKYGSGPSGCLDSDGWRWILCSTAFGTTNKDLRKAVVEMIKKYVFSTSV